MKNLEKYLSKLEKEFPDIRERLNGGAEETEIIQLEERAGHVLPGDFKELYHTYDGENLKETGFMAGLRFLSLMGVLSEFDFFKGVDQEMTAMGTRAVKDAPLSELCWIPFAFDGSRAFLAMDLSPAAEGKTGQIIAVDYDSDRTWLLADSMDGFLGKMATWLEEGTIVVNRKEGEETFLMEVSGHLFNSLEKLSIQEKSSQEEISLPAGYWQERYEGNIVPKEVLDKEKSMRLANKTVDCVLFEHMDNLKELILHDCRLEHIEGIARAPQLKTLFFVNCTFGGEDLSRLSQAPALKELSLNVMDASGMAALAGIKTLQSLRIREVTGISLEEVTCFEKLQELSIEKMGLRDGSFLGEMKNLKKLDLHRHEMDNLDFLAALTKLTEFHLAIPAANEDGLAAVQGLKKLKEFVYPVRDMGIYADLPKLETIGLAAEGVHGFETLAGSKVNSFKVCGKDSPDAKEKLKKLAEEIKKYVKVYSYGQEYT